MHRFFISFVLTILLLYGCKEESEKHSPTPEQANQVIMNFKLLEAVKGITNFKLQANKALVYDTQTIVYEVNLDFYKDGTPYAKLTSDSGRLFTSTNDMCAYGNVKVVGIEDAVLETSLLNWASEREIIYTDTEVLITKENKKIKGRCFESDPGLTNIKLKETYGYVE